MAGPLDGYTADTGYAPGFVPAAKPVHDHGTMGALLSSAATNVAPTAAGVATFSLGAGPGVALGAAIGGPAAPLTAAFGGLIGGGITAFGGSTVAQKAQDFIVGQLPDSMIKGTAFDPDVQARDQANHPYATTIGSILPQAMFLRPGLGGSAVREGASDIEKLLASRWTQAGTGAAVAGSVEAGSEYGDTGTVDPIKVGIQAVLGAALNTETRLGRVTGAPGRMAADGIVRGAAAARRWVNRPAPTGNDIVVGDQTGRAQFNDASGLDPSGYHADPQTGAVSTFGTAREAGRFATSNSLGDQYNVENVGDGRFALRKSARQVYDESLSGLPPEARAAAVQASERAGTVDSRAAEAKARSNLNVGHPEDDASTPDERAALHTVARENDVREASPLHPDPVGTGANTDRLAAMEAWLGVTGRVADVPSPAPLPATPHGGDLTTAINRAEGVGKNPMSSAEGHGQFLRSTWLDVYRRNFGGAGMSDAQVLALRNDPRVGDQMTAIYGRENAAGLRHAGLEDSPGNISLAHFLGLGGARDVLRASPDTPVESILPAKVIAANEKVLRGKSASDVIAWAHKRIGNASGTPPARGDAVPQWDADTDAVPDDAPPIHYEQVSHGDLVIDPLWGKDTDALGTELAETRGQGQQYHGARGELPEFQEGYYNPANIYGGFDTFYTTDALDIAKGYGRKNEAARIYKIDETSPVNMFDMEGARSEEEWNKRLGVGPNDIGLTAVAVELAAQENGGAPNLRQIMDMMRQESRNEGISRDEVQEYFDGIIYNLKEEGYGGMQHTGGLKTDRAAHTVKIYFDAKNQLSATDTGARFPRFDPGKAGHVLVYDADVGGGSVKQILDGRQRVNLARRTGYKGQMDAMVLRESDGITLEQAREIAAIKNEEDRAPALAEMRRIADLPNDQFGAVLNGHQGDSEISGGAGRPFSPAEADGELADGRGLPGGATPADDAAEAARATEGFSEPIGPAADAQTQSVEHDLLMELPEGTFRLSEEGDEMTAQALLKDADADLSAVDKVRACMVPPKGEA